MSATLSPEARDALQRAQTDETSVRLPEQLPRPVYLEVNKVLNRIAGGGRWDRRAAAHLFGEDPRPVLEELLAEPGPVAIPEDRDKQLSFWPTPQPVAEQMTAALDGLRRGAWVLEPSAGDGALADAITARRPDLPLTCVEPDDRRARACRARGHDVAHATFAEWASDHPEARVDAVLMNPPFTEPGRPTAWIDHITLALSLLAPTGHLVSVAPASYGSSQRRAIVELRAEIDGCDGVWIPLDPDAFKISGTAVRTGLITVGGLR